MREFLKTTFRVFGAIALPIMLIVRPIVHMGEMFDAGTLTGTAVAWSVVSLILAKPLIAFWTGLFDDEER